MAKIFFATPSYDSTVHCLMVKSLLAEMDLLREMGVDFVWEPHLGCCYLPIARNKLVAMFMETDFTHLMFIDGDVQWESGAVVKLLKADVDFIAGIYPYKTTETGFPINWGKAALDKEKKIIEVGGVPTGFLLLKKEVFIQFDANYLDLEVVDERDNSSFRNYFDTAKRGKVWWGEDLHFCNLWRDIGGKIYVEPNINFYHHGFAGFYGNFLNYIDQQGKNV